MLSINNKNKYLGYVLLLLFAYFCWLMLEITFRYIPFSSTASFLQIKQTEVQGLFYYLPVFYVHVYTSIFCLIAGFSQFSSALRNNYPAIHKGIGYVYVTAVLLFSSPTGFVMGLHANGGLVAVFFFTILAILWWWFTFQAIQAIRNGDVKGHRRFMIRSFALCLSAISLRLWKVVLVYLFQPAPMDVYIIIAGLGWMPNLLIAEYLIRKKIKL